MQRLTAIYIGLFSLFVIVRLLYSPINEFIAWQAWMNQPLVRVGWTIFIFSLLYHGWVGLHSVFMDYAKPLWVRFLVDTVSTLVFLAMSIWTILIIFNIS